MTTNRAWVALATALALGACSKPATGPGAAAPGNAAPAAVTNAAPAPPGAPQMAGGTDAADAKTFLDGLYSHYKSPKGGFEAFGKDRKTVFDTDLVNLLDEDNKLLKGDEGAIESDWLCECQDFVSIQANVAVRQATADKATASADFRDTGMSDDKPRHADFSLAKENGAWRIDDISEDGQSLRQIVAGEVKALKSGAQP